MNETYGHRLREWRKSVKLSQRGLAAELGISQGYVGDIESERAEPSRNFLIRLSERFGLSADWLLHGRGEITPDHAPIQATAQPTTPLPESMEVTLQAALLARFQELLATSSSQPDDRVVPSWHEALEIEGSAPIALDRSWFIDFDGDDEALRAVPIIRSTLEAPLHGRMIALTDPAAPQAGGPTKWALIADGITQLAEVEFHRHATVLHRFRTDRSSVTLWYDERQAVELLGRVVWLGVAADTMP